MKNIYADILLSKSQNKKLLAILLDPDKIIWETLDFLALKINESPATHILIGGSRVLSNKMDELILRIKQSCTLPIILFPGNPSQISDKADGILFLSLISGRNPDYLIGHQVAAAPVLKRTNLEVIPTGYILIGKSNESAVSIVSKTLPLCQNNTDEIVHTAQAGEMLGKKLIYLEAGSGAKDKVAPHIINEVSRHIEIPLIVGGGIMARGEIAEAYRAGADMVVIGTAFENDFNFFDI